MAQTLTITVTPGTTVVLPSDATLSRAVGATLTVNVDNQSGVICEFQTTGSPSNFNVTSVPASIAAGANDDTLLEVLSSGTVVYTSDGTVRTTTVNAGGGRLINGGLVNSGLINGGLAI